MVPRRGRCIAVVWNTPVAGSGATADFVISSPLFHTACERAVPRYDEGDADVLRAS
jgi:methylglyoxal synthase